MFDNLEEKKQNDQQINPLKDDAVDAKKNNISEKPAEDIFAETEPKVEKPAVFQPKENNFDNNQSLPKENKSEKNKKIIILILIIIAFIIIGVGGFFTYKTFFSNNNEEIYEENLLDDQNLKIDEINSQDGQNKKIINNNSELKNKIINTDMNKDTDEDGLTDKEEKVFGTDINNIDSDNDGLHDREEVKVYKTDPLNPDTDGDTYLDGDEVKNGYNPKGSGKLYQIK